MRRSFLIYLLALLPLSEIAVFILVGSEIGVGWTILLVLATTLTGMTLLRMQGFGALARIRAKTEAGEIPGRDLVHAVMIMVAGVLLLVPGFITDTLGLLLFIPAVRERGWRFLKDRITVVANVGGSRYRRGPAGGSGTIDLEEDEFSRREPPAGNHPRVPPPR